MASSMAISAPGASALDALNEAAVRKPKHPGMTKEHAKKVSQEFEQVYLNTMFQQMTAGLNGDGPFGGQGSSGVWRSFLTDEYAKGFVKSGGIGIAAEVYSALIAQQGAR